jgi:prepilin-type N-terminal cleavage/methylation domain-containing protein
MKIQRGDTLVEVMIAMAIVGSVIAISYSTASRALSIGRWAQERTEAVKLVEGQIETLKASASSDPLKAVYTLDTTSASFCVASDGTINKQALVDADFLHDTMVTAPSGEPVAGQIYNSNCAQGPDGRYKLSIVRADTGAGTATETNQFFIRARWDRLGGGRDEVAIYYRLHERQFK